MLESNSVLMAMLLTKARVSGVRSTPGMRGILVSDRPMRPAHAPSPPRVPHVNRYVLPVDLRLRD